MKHQLVLEWGLQTRMYSMYVWMYAIQQRLILMCFPCSFLLLIFFSLFKPISLSQLIFSIFIVTFLTRYYILIIFCHTFSLPSVFTWDVLVIFISVSANQNNWDTFYFKRNTTSFRWNNLKKNYTRFPRLSTVSKTHFWKKSTFHVNLLSVNQRPSNNRLTFWTLPQCYPTFIVCFYTRK